MSRITQKQIIDEANAAGALLDELGVPEEQGGEHLTLVQRIRLALNPRGTERLYTSHEAGKMLQMDPSSIVKWVNDGLLPAYKTPGGHRRVKASELLAFLQKHQMYIPPELAPLAAMANGAAHGG